MILTLASSMTGVATCRISACRFSCRLGRVGRAVCARRRCQPRSCRGAVAGNASGLIGTARRIRASTSWSEPCTMWTAIVGFSGSGKTPGIDTVSARWR